MADVSGEWEGQLLSSAKRAKRLERMKKVGAQRPTKIPKRSACAWDSGSVPPVRNQIAIEPMIDAKPRMKQRLLRGLRGAFMVWIEWSTER